MTPEAQSETADRLRHLVADTSAKMNHESADRQYLLEDLMRRVAAVAEDLDGEAYDYDNACVGSEVYPLEPREAFGMLSSHGA